MVYKNAPRENSSSAGATGYGVTNAKDKMVECPSLELNFQGDLGESKGVENLSALKLSIIFYKNRKTPKLS